MRRRLQHLNLGLFFAERKVEFDYEKFGDSPPCLSDLLVEEGTTATFQGAGVTELGDAGTLLEASVNTISNANCQHWIDNSTSRIFNLAIERHLTEGLTDTILCTLGIYNDNSESYTVSFISK